MNIVIMAGGKGTRFWPRSIEERPKQFLALTSQETMLQSTYARFRRWLPAENIHIVTSQSYLPLVHEQLPALDAAQTIAEPAQRDTAPCIALAACLFLRSGSDDVIATVPSDQYIPDDDALREALEQAAIAAAAEPVIVTLGIVPTRPESGYGYIELDAPHAIGRIGAVKSFIEKPEQDRAAELIRSKHVLWNSGIYIWKPSTVASYMKRFAPDMWRRVEAYADDEANAPLYCGIPKQSIDYAVIEKAERIYSIPVAFEWDDVGAWTSLERIFAPDEAGNIAQGDVTLLNAADNIVYSEDQRTIVIGARDLIVVATRHGLLVCDKSEEQKIKLALERFGKKE
ncbi:mannose-1-phosphate guanylyltransferase [Paenibacillus cymbidii]|uniref:mannose-1-phosphate guanylyltransferase n=1 Tax=Paenibacillus cymbidii TaxID=1639034 RepID=UPI0010817206|nr:sugar phosphate nucleotidyltransferase [Paenibacillus cymbidii]